MGHPSDSNDRAEAANVAEDGHALLNIDSATKEDDEEDGGGTLTWLRRADLM